MLENAPALARLVTPQVSKGYLRKRKRARGGYDSRFFVLDSGSGELRYYADERTANQSQSTNTSAGPAVDGTGGVIALDLVCAVFNEPAKKGGCGVKLIGNEREWTLVAPSRQQVPELSPPQPDYPGRSWQIACDYSEAIGWARALHIARARAVVRLLSLRHPPFPLLGLSLMKHL